jgi:Protein of unknown function (DUF1648)
MSRKFQALIATMWLFLPLMAVRYWQLWDRLPARMVSHFNAAGEPNGWMLREQSLTYTLIFLGFLLAVLTIVLYATHWKKTIDTFSWALLAFFYLIIGAFTYLCNAVIEFNFNSTPIAFGSVLIIIPIAAIALIIFYVTSKRGTALPALGVFADEVHAGPIWALVLALPFIADVYGISVMPVMAAKITMGVIAVMLLASAVFAGTGFHYLFSPSGVEIRTLGFRLQSIPANQIQHYAAGIWSIAGGYGIRGIGNTRAYVWGNRGVRIKTTNGEVFLGHSDPVRIVDDLDAIKQSPQKSS